MFLSLTLGITSQHQKTTMNKPCNRQFAVYVVHVTLSVAARSKAWICGRSLAGIAGSISAGLLWALCVVTYRFLSLADRSSRGILPIMVCLSVIVKSRRWGFPDPLEFVAPWKKNPPKCVFFSILTFYCVLFPCYGMLPFLCTMSGTVSTSNITSLRSSSYSELYL